MRDRRGRRRMPGRRWCIPPAILREADETLEASHVLEEHGAELALVLWNALRDVTLWAAVEPARRTGLFTGDAAGKRLSQLVEASVDPALEVALTTLASVVSSPATANAEIVSLVCLEVSRWARDRSATGTALAFAQAAALAMPEDPGPACMVGELALRWGREGRAETWLRRSIGLARRARDWHSYAQAYVHMGALYAKRGVPEHARRYYTFAVRAARRQGLLPIRGSALHGLFLVAMHAGELDEAERFARAAMRAYGRRHPRLPELLHDVASLWVMAEDFGRAIPMLQKLLVGRTAPEDRALTLALLARAAAGAGDRRLYEETWRDSWSIIIRPGAAGHDGHVLLELARAAARLGDWVRVEQATRLHATQPMRQVDSYAAEELAELSALAKRRRL